MLHVIIVVKLNSFGRSRNWLGDDDGGGGGGCGGGGGSVAVCYGYQSFKH